MDLAKSQKRETSNHIRKWLRRYRRRNRRQGRGERRRIDRLWETILGIQRANSAALDAAIED